VAECLAGVDVGQVHLNGRQPHRGDGVAQSVAGVGQRAGVDQDALAPQTRVVDGVDEHALVVGLHHTQLGLGAMRLRHQRFVDLGQRPTAVNFRLALPQQIQIWSMQDEYAHGITSLVSI